MKTFRTYISGLLIGMVALAGAIGEGVATPSLPPQEHQDILVASNGDCYAIGERYAAQQGAQLARATRENRGGQDVCVVIVLMPARDGERPRRMETVLPLN